MKFGRGSGSIIHLFNLIAKWVGGQRHTTAASPTGKIRYPLNRRLGEPQFRYGQVWKISSPTQPVKLRYYGPQSEEVLLDSGAVKYSDCVIL